MSKIQYAHIWEVFCPYHSAVLKGVLKAFHFFYEFFNSKNYVKDSSGVFIRQGSGYLEPQTLTKTKNTKNNEMRL